MLIKEEIEKARSNILRGNDIESACLIMEEVIWNGLVIIGSRVNIVKIAMRQILNFIKEYKDKGFLDVVREKVQLKEKNNQLEQENNKLNKMIDLMTEEYATCKTCLDYTCKKRDKNAKECIKQYFEEKVEEKL